MIELGWAESENDVSPIAVNTSLILALVSIEDRAVDVSEGYAIPLSVVSRIPINQRKLTICTKKNPKRTAVTVLV